MNVNEFFNTLWTDYIEIAPQAEAVRKLFNALGEEPINDHVAFRTLGNSPIAIDKLETVLNGLGYKAYGKYRFEQKKLDAKSFMHKTDSDAPKIFISELCVDELSAAAQAVLHKIIAQIPSDIELTPALFWAGRLWDLLSKADYEVLRAESEYAAWLSTIGIKVNHFTVSINQLKTMQDIQDVNGLLKKNGFELNSVGGEIKGSPKLLLEQSSTLADSMEFTFSGGESGRIPTCFYEFAKRYPQAEGAVFDGFIEGNADKIFESTNVR